LQFLHMDFRKFKQNRFWRFKIAGKFYKERGDHNLQL